MKNETKLHCILLLLLLLAASMLSWKYYMITPGGLDNPATVVIRKGMGSQEVSKVLGEAKVIAMPQVFLASQYALGNTKKFKAGEYFFPAHISPQEVVDKLVGGKVVVHKVTIPEGMKAVDVRATLLAEDLLQGELTISIPEGSVLPETYHYMRGDTRDMIAARMQQAMIKFVSDAWEKRDSGLPFDNKKDALILASIVEKETGIASERPHIASIFINRLKLGMRLQTDPAVMYGLEQKKGEPLGHALTLGELEIPTPYNTYLNTGLPPTPIANPGKDAILAVLHPSHTNDLYFVATGHGGHNFAATLEEHNRNVAAYRAALRNP